MKRIPLIAANWKMNPLPTGCLEKNSPYVSTEIPEIVVFPTFLDLKQCIDTTHLVVGAQCGRPEEKGPFTGDISMHTLKEIGCQYILCGHSERRTECGETDEKVAEQVKEALAVGLIPILCIGETQDERKKGFEKEIIAMQLRTILDLITDVSQLSALVIAYEPVWAIGTGENATPSDAQEMHVFIRSLLPKDIAESTRILYGGSVKPENAAGIFAEPDIDGARVGGASLNPESFRKIVESLPA